MATVALAIAPAAWLTRRVALTYTASAPRLGAFGGAVLLLGVMSVLASSNLVMALAGLVLGCGLLALAVIDLALMRLPDPITLGLACAGLAVAALNTETVLAHIVGGLAGYGLMALVALTYVRLRGRQGLGMGDAKLMGVAGLWLGWRLLPVVLLCACIGGLLWAAWLARRRKGFTSTTPIAFGAPLCLSVWLCWLVVSAQS